MQLEKDAMQSEREISDLMNLIGYGLAKFSMSFVKEFGFPSKAAFVRYIVQLGFAKTERAVLNRQDSFDPYFDNGRRGWFQRNQREHIKIFIDSLFGGEDAHGFADIVKAYISKYSTSETKIILPPAIKSRFKQLQETGKEAEFYFMSNYKHIPIFQDGILEDARTWGDGYDFQIHTNNRFLLAEVKGIRESSGSFRMTQKEFDVANEYKSDYILVVVSNLSVSPKLSFFENPICNFELEKRETKSIQTNYYSSTIKW